MSELIDAVNRSTLAFGSQMNGDSQLASVLMTALTTLQQDWMGEPIDPAQMPGAVPNDLTNNKYPMPKSTVNYTSEQIQAMINYIAGKMSGETGDSLTQWQTCLQAWTNLKSAMDAKSQIQSGSLSGASDAQAQQIQMDQSNLQNSVSVGSSAVDLKKFSANLFTSF